MTLNAVRPSLLGVEASFTGRRWEERLADARQGLAIAQQLDLPEIVGRVLAGRGIDAGQADGFLNPSLRSSLPDPDCLKGMAAAVARLVTAIEADERVAVFGDYDVDGATSSALLARFFRAIGRDLEVYIPDRIKEGYGPNETALAMLAAKGVKVVVTVDCGITAFEPLSAARRQGLDVVIVDHHAAEPRLPEATAVINPNRLDQGEAEVAKLGHLAAVGVTFLLIVALNRALRLVGFYDASGRQEPDLRTWLDLVALGTVCDVVALTGLNRVFVAQGLKVLAQRGNAGLAALCDVAGIDEAPSAGHLGFQLGPRVNAGGRIGEAGLGARLLATDDRADAAAMAARLDAFNSERRDLEARVLDQAIEKIESEARSGSLVLAAAEGWHPGVIGVVASRLKERYHRPVVIVALEGGIGKGSGRSVPGVDLGATIIAARQAGLLVNGGGHPMAAGLTLAADRLADLRAFLETRIAQQLSKVSLQPSLGLDGMLQPGAATGDFLERLEACAPFGVGNPQPRFAYPAVRIAQASVVGENHVRCRIVGASGGSLKGIAFRALDGPLGEALLNSRGRPLHLAGKVEWDRWRGPGAVQVIVEDAAQVQG